MSDRYAVIGNPVAHSKSPWIHARFARQTGQDLEYGRIEAPLDGFVAAVDRFRAEGGKGLNVTLPFKEQARRYSGRVSERGGSVLLMGAGGAAQAVVGALLEARAGRPW